jgi:hypothetical protein
MVLEVSVMLLIKSAVAAARFAVDVGCGGVSPPVNVAVGDSVGIKAAAVDSRVAVVVPAEVGLGVGASVAAGILAVGRVVGRADGGCGSMVVGATTAGSGVLIVVCATSCGGSVSVGLGCPIVEPRLSSAASGVSLLFLLPEHIPVPQTPPTTAAAATRRTAIKINE